MYKFTKSRISPAYCLLSKFNKLEVYPGIGGTVRLIGVSNQCWEYYNIYCTINWFSKKGLCSKEEFIRHHHLFLK